MMHVFKKKSLAFLFSDFADEFDEKLLKIASKKHQLLGLRVFDEKDNEIPDVGYAFFRDIETGKQIWVNTSNQRWRYNYAEAQKQKIRHLREAFEKSSASFVEVNAEEDYTKILYNYFQKK
jgi:hypothetical protein